MCIQQLQFKNAENLDRISKLYLFYMEPVRNEKPQILIHNPTRETNNTTLKIHTVHIATGC